MLFRSLIKCAVTGCTVSSDRKEAKKNKNTYLITWNPADISKKIYIPENDILEEVAKVFKALEQELIKNRVEREMHEGADEEFKNTLITAFNLANRASELFESSKTLEKRELINFVFSNLSLKGRKLEYTLRKPFDMLVEMSRSEEWLPRKDSNLRQSD